MKFEERGAGTTVSSFDTQEALLIDAMDNADSIYTVFARLQSLAVKCGCAGKLLLHESVPYTDERCLLRSPRRPFPPFGNACSRSCSSALSSARMASTPSRTGSLTRTSGNRRDARGKPCAQGFERARKNGKGTRQVKKDKVVAYLTEHPDATNTEVAEKTGGAAPPSSSTARNMRQHFQPQKAEKL